MTVTTRGRVCMRGSASSYTQSLIASLIANHGYEATFPLSEIRSDPPILLTLDPDDEALRLVAPGHDGATWVRRVTRLVVH